MILTPECEGAVSVLEARLTGEGAPFELEILAEGTHRYVSGPHTLAELYRRAARLGATPLLIDGETSYTYETVFDPALRLAAALQTCGLSGKRIGLSVRDRKTWLVWFVASTAAGLCCVLLPEDADEATRSRCVQLSGAELIVDDAVADHQPLRNLIDFAPEDSADNLTLPHPDTEALIVFSSGSTGQAKGIIHTHRSLMTGYRNMMLGGMLSAQMLPSSDRQIPPSRRPAILLASPLSYIAGYSAFLLVASAGGLLALAGNTPDAETVARYVEAHGLTSIAGASPDLLRRIVRLPGPELKLASLRQIQIHGAELQSSLVKELQTVLPATRLMTGYGLTETAGSIAMAPVDCVADIYGLSGRCVPGAEVRVVSDTGLTLGPDETGNIEVRGDMLFRGYLGEASGFAKGDWFSTGDVGCMDLQGWLTVHGRRTTLAAAELAGLNLIVLEDRLRAQSEIDDVAVLAGQQGLLIALQTRTGHQPDRDHLDEIVRGVVGEMREIEWKTFAVFPRTRSGKIDRLRLQHECV